VASGTVTRSCRGRSRWPRRRERRLASAFESWSFTVIAGHVGMSRSPGTRRSSCHLDDGLLPRMVHVRPGEAERELGVAVQILHQVARLLRHPGPGRVGTHPTPTIRHVSTMHEHQHVQGLEEHGLDGESRRRGCLWLAPRGTDARSDRPGVGPVRGRATKDRADRRGGDDDAEALELTLDPHASPAGVLPCRAHDQRLVSGR
jgi:hypothetical protein